VLPVTRGPGAGCGTATRIENGFYLKKIRHQKLQRMHSSFRRTLVTVATQAHFRASRTYSSGLKYSVISLNAKAGNSFKWRQFSSGAEVSAEKEPVTVVIESATTKPDPPVVILKIPLFTQ
jgi:hypothetical protein